jgi:hypothetical protein
MRRTLAWTCSSLPLIALLTAAGCEQLAPPLDELPLRDALRADPDVVAALPDDARQRLAARLALARVDETSGETMPGGDLSPQLLIARVDQARELRGQDALVASVVTADGVQPVTGATSGATAMPLPSPAAEGPASPTAALEALGLAAGGGDAVRALLAASGARRLQRVVGWPVGAVAIGETVYVNAAWLVALAPASNADGGAAVDAGDPGATAGAASGRAGATTTVGARATPAFQNDGTPGTAGRSGSVDAGAPPSSHDAGVYVPPVWDPGPYVPPPSPTPPTTYPPAGDSAACAGSCDTSSSSSGGGDCSSGGDSSGDACNSSSDSSGDDCSSSSDGSDQACQSSGDDGAACESSNDEGGCQIAHGRRRGGNGTLLTLVAPLAFLLPRRRR